MTRTITAEDLWAIARVGRASVAKHGQGIFPVTTFDMDTDAGLTRIYSLADGKPLTGGTSATAPAIAPSGHQFAFLRKVDDRPQVHVMPMDGGESEVLTSFPLGVEAMRWLPDESGLIVAANVYGPDPDRTAEIVKERSKSKVTAKTTEARFYRYWDTWLTDEYVTHLFKVELTGSTHDLTPTLEAFISLPLSGITENFDISPDGTQLVVSAALLDHGTLPRPRYELWSVPMAGGELTQLTPDNPGDDDRPVFLPDGRIVFGASAELDFYASPVRLTLLESDGTQTALADDWDLSPSSWVAVPDGSGVLAIAEESAQSRAYLVPLDGEEPRRILADHSVSDPAATPDRLFLLQQSLSKPPELICVPWVGESLERLTHFNDASLDGLHLGEVEDTTIEGADGAAVQMYVIYPPDFDSSRQYPLVHMIHGGPHASFGDVWHQR